jgi:hypothetical protein
VYKQITYALLISRKCAQAFATIEVSERPGLSAIRPHMVLAPSGEDWNLTMIRLPSSLVPHHWFFV